jgi:hypothetical protein
MPSSSPSDWFNLSSASVQSNDLDLALDSFATLEELHKQSNFQSKPSFWVHLYWFILALMNAKEYLVALDHLKRLSHGLISFC